MSDLYEPLLEEIASRGYGRLMEDYPHILGQWVHSETTDVETMQTIHVDLLKNGEKF